MNALTPRQEMQQIVGRAKELADYAMRAGLLTKKVEPVAPIKQPKLRGMSKEERLRRQRDRERVRRADLQARGFTVLGTPRIRKTWPQLRGLTREQYLIKYHELQRQLKTK